MAVLGSKDITARCRSCCPCSLASKLSLQESLASLTGEKPCKAGGEDTENVKASLASAPESLPVANPATKVLPNADVTEALEPLKDADARLNDSIHICLSNYRAEILSMLLVPLAEHWPARKCTCP